MAEASILTEDDRVELIGGDVARMGPVGARHAACIRRLTSALAERVPPPRGLVSVQNPLNLGEFDEPVPDLVVLRYRDDFYASAHPTAADVILPVEVADTSLEYDQKVKLALYTRAGIAEYWIADLKDRRLLVHSEPADDVYKITRTYLPGDVVESAGLSELAVRVEELLPE